MLRRENELLLSENEKLRTEINQLNKFRMDYTLLKQEHDGIRTQLTTMQNHKNELLQEN